MYGFLAGICSNRNQSHFMPKFSSKVQFFLIEAAKYKSNVGNLFGPLYFPHKIVRIKYSVPVVIFIFLTVSGLLREAFRFSLLYMQHIQP